MTDYPTQNELRRLRANLVYQGIPQAEIAHRAGVSRSMVTAVLSGRKRSAHVLSTIKEALKRGAA